MQVLSELDTEDAEEKEKDKRQRKKGEMARKEREEMVTAAEARKATSPLQRILVPSWLQKKFSRL